VQNAQKALQYDVGVGAEGYGWSGIATVHSKQELLSDRGHFAAQAGNQTIAIAPRLTGGEGADRSRRSGVMTPDPHDSPKHFGTAARRYIRGFAAALHALTALRASAGPSTELSASLPRI
jgi:hypothetical protein